MPGNTTARKGDYAEKTKMPITVAHQIQAIPLLLLYGFGMSKGEIDAGDVKIDVTYADRARDCYAASGARCSHRRPRIRT